MKLFITLLIFAILAGVFLWQTYRLIRRSLTGLRDALASRSWQSAQGKITIVSVKMESLKYRRRQQAYYRPWVQSSYTVNGKDYVCDCFAFNDHLISTDTKKKAEELIKKYQAGQSVQVYYDPNAPQKSVLEPGNISPSLPSVLGGVIYFFLAFLPIWLAILAVKNQ